LKYYTIFVDSVERGMERRKKEGKDISAMSPVCTIMVGRLDDWLKVIMNKKGIVIEPGYLEWAGVAAAKKAYQLYKERGYRTRLLNVAYRNHYHWSQFIGGDMSMTITADWQQKINSSDVEVKNRINDPVDPAIIAELEKKFPDFRRAYDEKGMKPEEFDSFGATRRTLLAFIGSYTELVGVIRGIMIADPDAKGNEKRPPGRALQVHGIRPVAASAARPGLTKQCRGSRPGQRTGRHQTANPEKMGTVPLYRLLYVPTLYGVYDLLGPVHTTWNQ
jgi:hypothetical protein